MRQNIAKSALWVTVSEIIFNLSGFIIHSILGRILGPADYGRYGIIVTLTTMVIILIGNGIPTAMAKYISEYFETDARMVSAIKKQAIILQTGIIGAVTLLFYICAPLISRILGDPTLTPLFRLSTLIIPAFAAASFYFSYYTGLHRFNLQATLKTLRSIFRIGLVVGLAYFFGVKGSVTGYIIAPTSVFLVALALDKFSVDKRMRRRRDIQEKRYTPVFPWKNLVNYAWRIVLFFLAYELLISIDLYLVKGILHDDRLTGIYNASLTVGRIPYYVFYAMTIFLLPMISRSTSQNNHQETNRILTQSLRIIMLLLIPLVVIMSAYSLPILKLLYGMKYIEGAYPMSILVYGVGFLTIFYVLSFAMNGAGKTKIPMYISVIGVIINTVLNYFLIKKLSITGSAIATSITSLIIAIAMLYYLWRDFDVTVKIKSAAKAAVAGLIIYYVSTLLSHGRLIFLLWSVLLFALYILILYLLREVDKKDLEYLISFAKKRKGEEMEQELSGNEPTA
jgi:stage V sporulation protein B